MSFSQGFFNLHINFSDIDNNIFEDKKERFIQHPEESLLYLSSRIYLYLLYFEEDVQFSKGLFEPLQPTICIKNSKEQITKWVQLGEYHENDLLHALRLDGLQVFNWYVFKEYSEHAVNLLRRMQSKINTKLKEKVEINLFLVSEENLIQELINTRMEWTVMRSDNMLQIITKDEAMTEINEPEQLQY